MTSQANKRAVWARIVTNVLCPPVVLTVVALWLLAYAAIPARSFLLYGLLYILFYIVLPGSYVVWQTYRGHITDIHMPKRSERFRPFVIGVACALIGWLVLNMLGAPRNLVLFATFSVVDTLLIAGITFYWQISIHGAAIAGATAIVGTLLGPMAAVWASPLIVIVGASRVQLRRHTPVQVLAGAALGAVTALLVFNLF